MDFPGGSVGKESACNVRDIGLIPGLERSPGGGHGNQLQYSCLGKPTDRGAWWANSPRGRKSQTRLSDYHRVSDAIQPSHPLSSPFPPAPNPSQHQSHFSNESTLCPSSDLINYFVSSIHIHLEKKKIFRISKYF